MGDIGYRNLKALFIGVGEIGQQARDLVQPLFSDLIRQERTFPSLLWADLMAGSGPPMLCTAGQKSLLKTPSRCLRDTDLVYLCGTPESDDFPNARHTILKAMGKSFLFTFLVGGPGRILPPPTDQECVVRVQGPTPTEVIAHFVRDFTGWNIFPRSISCDWADIKRCLGGQEKFLAVYCSQSHDYEKGFTEFLTQNRFELARSSSILLHCGWNHPDVPLDELFWPVEMLEGYVREDVPMVYLETTKDGLDACFQAFLLL